MLSVLKVPCKVAPYTECRFQPSTIQQWKNQKEGNNTRHEATEGNNMVTLSFPFLTTGLSCHAL